MKTIIEYKFINYDFNNKPEIIKRVYCSNQKQAFDKLKFLYPYTYFCIKIEKGKRFKDFNDFLENRNYFKQ